MNRPREQKVKVGELKPSQLMYTFGVGALLDLPSISALIMGLDDWDTTRCTSIEEDRLLSIVRRRLGPQIERFLLPPVEADYGAPVLETSGPPVGVPVAPFPRWLRCQKCDVLSRSDSGLFRLDTVPFAPDRTRFVHANCSRAVGRSPTAMPVRFVVACKNGHLDDFPWVEFVHKGSPCNRPLLRLREFGAAGDASDIWVSCDTCKASRRMAEAFGQRGSQNLPPCAGNHPHLRSKNPAECEEPLRTVLLGASNNWFPMVLSSLAIPRSPDRLSQLIDMYWAGNLQFVTSVEVLSAFRARGDMPDLAEFSDQEIWQAMQARGPSTSQSGTGAIDVKKPEWDVLSTADSNLSSADFRIRAVAPPQGFSGQIEKVVLLERMREVRALIGFTRIESPGDFLDTVEVPEDRRVSLSRQAPRWLPASEVRGEGIFIQFREDAIEAWMNRQGMADRERLFFEAHRVFRSQRRVPNPDDNFPGLRFVLLHSFAHALLRQLCVECGYTAASLRERIYSRPAMGSEPAMAGVLIYTSAPDSEGTLGGLVGLGEPDVLGRHITQAFENLRLCSADPLCSEQEPGASSLSVNGAACHACLFVPETSCERGNKYLDRTILIPTFTNDRLAFFA